MQISNDAKKADAKTRVETQERIAKWWDRKSIPDG